jgi:GR25 family glycosyltransferase involved in LPS biosynthesis
MSNPFLKKCPKFYYINLDRSPERKERIEKMFHQHKLHFQRIQAVDGKELTSWDERLNPYEQGCTLSHLKAIEEFYKSGEEMAIICEDDMTMEFFPYWNKPIKNVIGSAPSDWEIILLGYIIWPHNYKHLQNLYNPFMPIIYNSTLSYLINRSGAEKILTNHTLETPNLHLYTKIRPVADVIIYDIVKTYVYKYSLFTYPDNNSSTIHDHHSDFHTVSKIEAKKMYGL